jgi:hypothetical protein
VGEEEKEEEFDIVVCFVAIRDIVELEVENEVEPLVVDVNC